MLGDNTKVKGIRLTDYQIEKLKERSRECGITDTDYVRALLDNAISGKISLNIDIRELEKIAKKKEIETQTLIDLIVEQLNDSFGDPEQ